jgi:8-oxo-dGTP pyrophosphatase MutT (NUDIX family)
VTNIPDARPASTVVLLRDTHNGMETLMLKRNKALMFAGGLWVFPGGALEPTDIDEADGNMDTAARIAAAREAEEECGLRPDLTKMVHLSRWTTPVVEPKRFQTWIYAAPLAESAEIEIDGSEIHDFCWIGVADAVAQHEAGQLGMLPPTYITLCSLLRYPNTAAMTEAETQRSPHEVFPIFTKDDGAVAVLFEGDAEYPTDDDVTTDARHRAVMQGTNWVYLHENVAAQYPAFVSNET